MKTFNAILILIGILFIASCAPDLTFTEPQPPDVKNETKFKRRYRGDYRSLEDSAILTITKNSIKKTWYVDIKVHKDSIELKVSLEGGKLEMVNIAGYEVTQEGDSVRIVGETTKHLFNLSEDQVLRYYKGYYFLNSQEGDDLWTVKMLSLEKGLLSFKRFLGTEAELTKLSELTSIDTVRNAEGEAVDYRIHPTLSEFREILRSAHFGDGGSYKKIK